MTDRFCRVCRGWHDLDKPWPHNCRQEIWVQRSHLPAPDIIGDTIDPIQSMLDGKMYDSKSSLRSTYKQAGVVEVGNDSSIIDPKPPAKSKPDRKSVRGSVRRAFSQAGLGA